MEYNLHAPHNLQHRSNKLGDPFYPHFVARGQIHLSKVLFEPFRNQRYSYVQNEIRIFKTLIVLSAFFLLSAFQRRQK